jgi:hypothetical protein
MSPSPKGEPTKKGKDPVKVRRQEQLDAVNQALEMLETQRTQLVKTRMRAEMLDSVSLGLYEELDKLTRKAPAEEVTSLLLEQANEVIREAREIGADDVYIQRLREFVPAGDMPQQRDVLLVIRQVRQGLSRLAVSLKGRADRLASLTEEAQVVSFALGYYLEFLRIPDRDAAKANSFLSPGSWFKSTYNDKHFDFAKLDQTDIAQHFTDAKP